MSDKGREYEIDGWMSIEEEGEVEDARDLAKKSFEKAIEHGNIGAYFGLANLMSDSDPEKIGYLRKAAQIGRLDAMWELYYAIPESETIEKYAWLKIVADNEVIADAKSEFDCSIEDFSEEIVSKINEFSDGLIKKITDSGYALGTGANPIFNNSITSQFTRIRRVGPL
jgi:hypothetical protein